MSIFNQIILSIIVLSFPLIFYKIYLTSIEKRAKQTIKNCSCDSSEFYKDLKVWIKNFDNFKKKSKFDLDPYQTTYSFNDCDLILNVDHLVIIGKTKVFGENRYLTPTIFIFGDIDFNAISQNRIVKCQNVRENDTDLELDFMDSLYPNLMTLVIKRIDNELKDKIEKRATTAKFPASRVSVLS